MAPVSREEFSTWVELVGKLSAAAASAALIGSVLYDWAYLRRLGLAFADVPTSLADHGRSALLWLPPLGLGVAAAFVIELFTRRTEHGRTESEIIAAAPNPKFTRRFRQSGDIAMLVGALLTIPGYVLFGDAYRSGLSLGAVALWVVFLRWVYQHPHFQARITHLGFATMVWIGIFVIAALFRGDSDAGAALASRRILHTISTNQLSGSIEVTLFRAFEKGALIRPVNDARLHFIFWTDIKAVTAAYTASTPYPGLLCWLWPIGCPDSPPSR